MARDVIIGGNNYTVSKINDVFEQTYLLSRLAPLVGGMADGNFAGLFDKIGSLPKDTFKEIYFGLLKCVKRKNDNGSWSPIASDNALMFQDITVSDGFSLCKEAFMENFEGFLQGSGLNLAAKA